MNRIGRSGSGNVFYGAAGWRFCPLAVMAVLFLAGCAAVPEPPAAEVHAAPKVNGYLWKNFAGQPGGLGNVDGKGVEARFCQPFGLSFDPAGNLYVADFYNYAIRKIAPDGTVTTLAGCVGEPGVSDGTGNSARFDRPVGVAADAAGNVYVADSGNHVIRKVTPEGVVTTLAGRAGEQGDADGAARAARFRSPCGVAVDGAGNVYVADTGNHTLRKIAASGTVMTLAGKTELKGGVPLGGYADGKGAAARFRSPRGMAVDGAGNVYVADTENAVLRKVAADGTATTLAGRAGSSGSANGVGRAAQFSSPQSVAMDAAGNLFVADAGNQVIRKVTPAGAVSTLTNSAARFFSPRGVAVDRSGYVAVSDNDAQTVSKIAPSGTVTILAGSASRHGYADGADAAVRFCRPTGIAVDRQKNVFVTDNFTHVIRKVTPDGVVTTLAGRAWSSGGDDGKGGKARFNWPAGSVADRAGNVYVADAGNHTIRKIAPDGTVTTLAGSAGNSGSADGAGSKARFTSPSGVALDSAGNVIVADCGNHLVRKVTPDGAVTTLAGNAGIPGSADGACGTARFNRPAGVAVDTLDHIYIADTGNHVVRKMIPGGVVTTLAGSAGMKGCADGTGAQARFNGPADVAVDLTGNLIVADRDNHLVRMVSPEGAVTTLGGAPNCMSAAEGFGSASRFAQPSGVAVDSDGIVYVADACNNRIVAGYWSEGGKATSAALSGPVADAACVPCASDVPSEPFSWDVFVGQPGVAGSEDGCGSGARLRAPQGLAIGEDDTLYVVDGCDNTVRKISPDGKVTTLPVARDAMTAPIGIATGREGECYVTDSAHVLWRVGADGTVRRLAGSANLRGDADGIGGAARFNFMPGVAMDLSGNVYVADHNNHTVRRMAGDGTVVTFAGRAGNQGCFDGKGDASRFMFPIALAVDRDGNVAVADGNKIRRITPHGEVVTLREAGTRFGRLDGIASDRVGNLYAADRELHVIWKMTPKGQVSRLGSSGLAMGGSGWLVTGLAVDRAGNVYVSDAVRNCIIRGVPQRRR